MCLWLTAAKTRGELCIPQICPLSFSNILDNWNSPRREEKWRNVTMLLNWPVLASMFQARLMWRLFVALGRWKVDVHQNQTEVCPWSSGPGGGTVEASLSTSGQSNWAVWTILERCGIIQLVEKMWRFQRIIYRNLPPLREKTHTVLLKTTFLLQEEK